MTQYIFLSHSQNDIQKVRKVRDYLEQYSFEPILFNLKCLTDSDELSSLVKREIQARKWFLYLHSKNAAKSPRVQAEVSYAGNIQDKQIFKLNLDETWFLQKIALNRMIKKMKG
ncbi:MAG: toll/interleukin-1 receptor domain-containing protein [Solobacterium sp.]|nr:toll/interleukin-1 receptor domain-containing protein [Solobacterium sp.]